MSTPLHPVVESSSTMDKFPEHVAMIMDGNGRWASSRGLPRVEGHRKGVEAVRKIVKVAGNAGVRFLTLYSFSSENWSRPKSEINELFGLLRIFIRRHLAELHQNNVRINVIGEREGIPADIQTLIEQAEELTGENDGLVLTIAFNYGARTEIASAVTQLIAQVQRGELDAHEITPDIIGQNLQTSDLPDPDLIIRTSGEQRLSNFLLWQAAYSEFYFSPVYWPDFGEEQFLAAIDEFCSRDRRFGALSAQSG